MPALQHTSSDLPAFPAPARTSARLAAGGRVLSALLRRLRPADTAGDRDRRTPRLRVLLVEDDAVSRTLTTTLLEQAGHRVTVAGNGREAIRRAGEGGLDVVLMDLRLPGQSGMAATRRIRALPDPAAASVPVVALSGSLSRDQRDECRAAGMDLHLPKPVTAEALSHVLAQAIRLLPDRFRQPAGGGTAAESGATGSEAAVPVLDRTTLDGHLQVLGPGRMAHIIDSFLRAAPETLAAARAGAESGDWETVSRAVHKLASGAGTVGLSQLAALARAAEQAADRGDPAAAQAGFDAVLHAYGRALPLMQVYRAGLPSS
ncbi:response regulator [Oleisolibacter albus]|uniref:response regulator n=1 Tax=Oleisolibacter albus TaxID=2171757 RepID=UPI000DF12284|nr:response regulator [Oleisolibacter albus]